MPGVARAIWLAGHMSTTSDPDTVLVIENDPDSGPAMLLDWIAEAGLRPVVIQAWDGDPLPADASGHLALIILGGGMLPDDDAERPWLPGERALLRATAGRAREPVLGICLGAQMITHTFGGTVAAKHGLPEKGVVDLELLPAAADDPVFGELPSPFPAIESHRDQITGLPPGAVLLASSERCANQVLRLGDRVWGVQFHPEVAAARVRQWDPDKLREWGFDPDAVLAEAERRDAELRALWRRTIGRFLDLARAQSADRSAGVSTSTDAPAGSGTSTGTSPA